LASLRREAVPLAGAAADQVRVGHQPQDREGLTVPDKLLALADEVIE
jgi:hypothetical protein